MFKKSIEAIIADGISGLESLKREAAATATHAQEQVQRCQSEIQALINLGKQIPEKVFDRYGHVLIGTIEQHDQSSSGMYAFLRLSTSETQLRGLMGPEDLKSGKYRVIVLLEKLS